MKKKSSETTEVADSTKSAEEVKANKPAAKKTAAPKKAASSEGDVTSAKAVEVHVAPKKKKRAEENLAPEDVATGDKALSQLEKGDVVAKFRQNTKDTGSPEVQIALLTRRLEKLTKHFAANPKDYHSQRGMLLMVSKRKGLLSYLRNENVERYRSVLSSLGLRK